MVKTPSKLENPHPMPLRHPKIHRPSQKGTNLERSKQKQVQFFDFLKELHGLERRGKEFSAEEQCTVKEIMEQVCRFFNKQKKYREEQLERYVMYLANLLNLLGDRAKQLCLDGQFRTKIRKFLSNLSVSKQQGKSKHSKIHAVLYILAILIYKEKIRHQPISGINHSLHSDKILVKLLLGLTLTKYKKMDKFYGVIIMHLATHPPNKRTTELIVKSILANISNIEHQPTLCNLLVFLRGQKNKVSLNYQDVVQGKIFQTLLGNYTKNIQKYLSYHIIDYLNYLLTLFPPLVHKIPTQCISNILSLATPNHFHHPFHQSTVISFAQLALKYSQGQHKNEILTEVVNYSASNQSMSLKMAHILAEHQIDQRKLSELLQSGYFTCLLDQINGHSEPIELRKAAQTYRKLVSKFDRINRSLSDYMLYQLQARVRVIEGRSGDQQVY